MSFGIAPPFENINTPQPTTEHQEKTAADQVVKYRLGLTSDSLDSKPFTEVDKQNYIKYNTNTPFLTRPPQSQVRQSKEDAFINNEAFEKSLNALLSESGISEETLDKLAEMHRLSPEERNPTGFPGYEKFYAFNQVVILAASVIPHLNGAQINETTEGSLNEAELNQLSANYISNNIANLGSEWSQEAREILDDLGPNVPGFEEAGRDLSDLKEAING